MTRCSRHDSSAPNVDRWVYGELEGRTIGHLTGPMTFGEIAYQLLNQTAVYLSIVDA